MASAKRARSSSASVVTFGEVMLRLATERRERFVQAHSFEATYGGGECNVAVSLQNFGIDSSFVTAVPEHEIGQACINYIRQFGVDTSHIIRSGPRLGLYYLESGASMRPSKVVYDRAGSSVSLLKVGQVDWAAAFQGKSWFHWTGITPALGDDVAAVVEEACVAAKKAGCTISCDFNYRGKLWSSQKAQSVMKPLMKYVDVAIGNEEDAEKCLGYSSGQDVDAGKLDPAAFKPVLTSLARDFGFKQVQLTPRARARASASTAPPPARALHSQRACRLSVGGCHHAAREP